MNEKCNINCTSIIDAARCSFFISLLLVMKNASNWCDCEWQNSARCSWWWIASAVGRWELFVRSSLIPEMHHSNKMTSVRDCFACNLFPCMDRVLQLTYINFRLQVSGGGHLLCEYHRRVLDDPMILTSLTRYCRTLNHSNWGLYANIQSSNWIEFDSWARP